MPRYFFDILTDDGAVDPDEDGTVLPDLQGARDEAFETLLDMAKDLKLPRGAGRYTLGMVVRDDTGRQLLTMAVGYSEESSSWN